jgi:hypothetical protein
MKEWGKNIYLFSTNQFLNSNMLEASNNTATQREDNEIVTQLCIMNWRIDQMANEFRDRLEW